MAIATLVESSAIGTELDRFAVLKSHKDTYLAPLDDWLAPLDMHGNL